MRILDIISEASILGSNYQAGHPIMLSNSPKGQKLLGLIKSAIPDYEGPEVIEKASAAGPYPAGTALDIPPGTIAINTTQPNAKGNVWAAQFKRPDVYVDWH